MLVRHTGLPMIPLRFLEMSRHVGPSGRDKTCTTSSNLLRSATQSEKQRDLATFPGKFREIGAIHRIFPLNRTGENVPPQPLNLLCGPFL
jgi:hypothetical protein